MRGGRRSGVVDEAAGGGEEAEAVAVAGTGQVSLGGGGWLGGRRCARSLLPWHARGAREMRRGVRVRRGGGGRCEEAEEGVLLLCAHAFLNRTGEKKNSASLTRATSFPVKPSDPVIGYPVAGSRGAGALAVGPAATWAFAVRLKPGRRLAFWDWSVVPAADWPTVWWGLSLSGAANSHVPARCAPRCISISRYLLLHLTMTRWFFIFSPIGKEYRCLN
jgi:hypothetical protein